MMGTLAVKGLRRQANHDFWKGNQFALQQSDKLLIIKYIAK